MMKEITVRILVPKLNDQGRVDYMIKTQTIRLPLKREDRLDFLEKIRPAE